MKLKPIGNRVVIRPKKAENKTKSGIYIPETAQEKNQEGEIVALGTEKEFPVKVGDYVLFEKYSGNEMTVGEEKYLIMETKDIIALIEK